MPALRYRQKLPRPDDPEILTLIAHDIAQGIPMRYAALHAGIAETTAYHWRMTGEAQLADMEQGDGELGSHALFVQTVKEAEAKCVRDGVQAWREAGKDWPKWATLLERRYPQDFGRRDRTEVNVTQRSLIVNVQAELGPDALRGLAQLYQELAQEEEQRLLPEGRDAD